MKILHVINSLARGGAEHLVTQLLPLLVKLGVSADLLVLQPADAGYQRDLMSSGVRVLESGVGSLYSPLQAVAISSRIADYDLVHAHLFPTLLWSALAKLRLHAPPMVFTEHSTSNRRRLIGLFKAVDAFAYSRFVKVVCVSRGVMDSLVGHLGWLRDRAVLIYNGIDLERFRCGASLPVGDLPPDRKSETGLGLCRLLCVANLTPAKGHELLLKAMKLLPAEVHLLLAGQGPLEARLRKQCRELGIDQRVHFLGFRADVARLYKSCDALVLPSLWEGFSLVAVEAMAGGLPVVASAVPGLREVVGESGLLFSAGDPHDLAAKIAMLLGSVRLQWDLREKGLLQAEKFSIERTAEEHVRLYAAICR